MLKYFGTIDREKIVGLFILILYKTESWEREQILTVHTKVKLDLDANRIGNSEMKTNFLKQI